MFVYENLGTFFFINNGSGKNLRPPTVHPVTKGTHLITRNGREPANREGAKRCSLDI